MRPRGSGSGGKWNDPRPEPGFTEGGILKTTDGGRNWARLENGLPPSNVLGGSALPSRGRIRTSSTPSTDNYDMRSAGAGGRDATRRAAADQARVIKGNEVYRSNDKGATWTLVSGQDEKQRAFMKGMSGTYAWVFGNIRVDRPTRTRCTCSRSPSTCQVTAARRSGRLSLRRRRRRPARAAEAAVDAAPAATITPSGSIRRTRSSC
jgi:photosystem II stability/assembly factor-like uncharacterized protein